LVLFGVVVPGTLPVLVVGVGFAAVAPLRKVVAVVVVVAVPVVVVVETAGGRAGVSRETVSFVSCPGYKPVITNDLSPQCFFFFF
jgi:hypothetical protein